MLRKAKSFIKDKSSEISSKYNNALKKQRDMDSDWKSKRDNFSKHQNANKQMFNSQQKERSDHFNNKQREARQKFHKDNDPVDRKKTAIATLATAGIGGAAASALKLKQQLNKLKIENAKKAAEKLNVDKEKVITQTPGFIEKYGAGLGTVGTTAAVIGAGLAARKYLKSRKK